MLATVLANGTSILAATDSATLNTVLWLAALALFIWGVWCIIKAVQAVGDVRTRFIVQGIILIIAAFLVGPGGVSIF